MIKNIIAMICIFLMCGMGSAYARIKLVDNVYAFETSEGLKVGAVFGNLPANGNLVSVTSPACLRAELHEMTEVDGIMKMRQIHDIIPTDDAIIHFTATGYHIMLMGLKEPLKRGTTIPITFKFKDGSSRDVMVPVVSRADKKDVK